MTSPAHPRRLPLADLLEGALVTLFTLWVVWPVLDPDTYLTGFDTLAYSGPNLDLTLAAVRDGRLPQWNEAIYGGVPHLANMHAAALYPLKFAFAWLPTHQAWDLLIALHVVILAVGTWWLVRRRLDLAAPAGAVAAIVVVGSGMVVVRVVFFEQILVVAWAPWLLGLVDAVVRGDDGRRARPIAALAVVTALTLTAGHAQLVYSFVPMTAVWAFGRLVDTRRWRRLVDLAVAGVLGGMLAAVQLLPTARLAARSANSGARDVAGAVSSPLFAVQPGRLPGTWLGDVTTRALTTTSNGYENLTYVGATAAVLAVVGLVALAAHPRSRWTAVSLAAIGAAGFVLSLGPRHVHHRAAFALVPGFASARVPARWSILTVFAVAVLAAYGTDALRRTTTGHPEVGRRTAAVVTAAVVIGAIAVVAGPFDLPASPALVAWAAFAAVVVAACWLAGRVGSGRNEVGGAPGRRRLAGAVAGAVVMVPLVGVVVELGVPNRFSAARTARAAAPFTDATTALTGDLRASGDRVFALTADRFEDLRYLAATLRPNANVTAGIRSIDGYDGGIQVTRRWVDAVSTVAGAGPFQPEVPLRNQLAVPLDPGAFAGFGVRWLLVDRDVFDVAEVAPDWVGPVGTDGPLAVYLNPAFSGDATLLDASGRIPRCTSRAEITVERLRPEAIDVVIDGCPEAGMLRLAEQWDAGWRATVDGQRLAIRPIDSMFLAVGLGDGREADTPITVQFRYHAPGLDLGLLLFGAAAAIVVALAVAGRCGAPLARGARSAPAHPLQRRASRTRVP